MSPAKKAAVTAVKDAATFDVAAWLEDLKAAGFKPRNVMVKMHFRGDLLPRLKYLVGEIQRLQGLDEVDTESGLDDADPLTVLVAEYTAVQAEFEAGGFLTFEFRPMNRRIQNETYLEWKETYGEAGNASAALNPEQDQTVVQVQEELILMRMAASCVDFPGRDKLPVNPKTGKVEIPPAAFKAFENEYGTPAFNTLVTGFLDAYEAGGEVDAPFLPRSSHDRKTEASSSG